MRMNVQEVKELTVGTLDQKTISEGIGLKFEKNFTPSMPE